MSAVGASASSGVSHDRLAWRARVAGVASTGARRALVRPPRGPRRHNGSRPVAEGASRPRTRRREVDTDNRGDGLFNAFESNVNTFLRLVRDTTGARASPSFVRGLIENTLTDITRRRVSVATLRLYPDGVVLEGLAIGENLTVDKLLVRAKLQPLLDVMGEWQTAAEGTPAPEIYIDSVRTAACVAWTRTLTGYATRSTSTCTPRAPSSYNP